MSAGVRSTPSLEPSPGAGEDVASSNFDQLEDNTKDHEESGTAAVWEAHPSRVEHEEVEEHQGWVSEMRREPRRSCIVSTASDRKDGSPRVHIGTFKGGDGSRKSLRSDTQDYLQNTWSRAFSFVRSRRSTTARSSVIASVPTFDIRESMNPEIAKEMMRIYQLEEPVDKSVWSYLTWKATVVEIGMCAIALWTMWFASFFAAFAHVYPICPSLLYLDTVLDLLYLTGLGLEFNISVVDKERRTEIQHRGAIIEIHLRSPCFYLDILSCFISPLLISNKLTPIDEYTFSYTYGINMIHAQVSKADILSVEELMLYCLVAPFGTLISAMAFGEITVLYQRLHLLEGQHSDDMAFSAEAMRILRVPPEMQKRVDQYFSYVHSSRDTFVLSKLMSSLNDPLLEELKLHLYKGLHCDPEFTKHVVMRLQDKIYSPGDYVIRAGQEGDCMFFIIKASSTKHSAFYP
ncbi:hypothetical protein Emag_001854 [Eimeria magna]